MKTLDQIEPRFLISAPIVITEPGSYVVTNNITSTSDVITIRDVQAGPVSIDLNGFQLETTGSGFVVSPISAVSNYFVTIKNGFLRQARQYGEAIHLSYTGALVENVVVRGGGLSSYNSIATTVRNSTWMFCNSVSGGIGITSGLDIGAIVVENNTLEVCGISISYTTGARVSGNTMRRSGMDLSLSTNCVIRDNTVSDAPGSGLVVGNRCHVERNVLPSNEGYGLVLQGNDNIYRWNSARGNTLGDFSNLGTGNTSGGGNYMPGLM
jgi:parallel beta-helix repeat protein